MAGQGQRRKDSATGKSKEQHELVGEVLTDRNFGRQIQLGLSDGKLGHFFRWDAAFAKSNKHFRDMFAHYLQDYDVARTMPSHQMAEVQRMSRPTQFLGNYRQFAVSNIAR